MKKKLSMLAAMALCVTVGGVYATWIYATQAVPTAYATMSITLTGTSSGGQAGTLTIAGTNVALKIDDPADGGIHQAALQYDATGFFTITFTPNTNAESDVKDGVDLQWYLGLYDSNKDNGSDKPKGGAIDPTAFDFTMKDTDGSETKVIGSAYTGDVFTTFNTAPTTISVNEQKYDKATGVYTYQLPMTAVMAKIALNEDLYLTTMEQYSAFETLLVGKMIHVHVQVAPSQVTNA
jgi:hypothetical protein